MGANAATNLSDAIAAYERHRVSMDIAKSTIRAQRSVLNRFLAVTGNIWVHSITETHVTRYFEEAAKTKQPQSMRNDHEFLAGFFAWCRHHRFMAQENDPLWGRRKPKVVVRERNRIHVSKFGALLDAAEARSQRDRAVIALLLYTLGRDREIADLRIRDVGLDAGYLTMRIFKTGMEDSMPISSELDRELRTWLTAYTLKAGPLQPHWFLVPGRVTSPNRGAGGMISDNDEVYLKPESRIRQLHGIVKPILESIGFPTTDENGRPMGEGSHTIRRSGARALFDDLAADGYDHALRVVQSVLHHKSMTTTERYIGVSADRKSRDELLRGHVMYRAAGANVSRLVARQEA